MKSDPPTVLKQEHKHCHGPDVLNSAVRTIENKKIKPAAEAGDNHVFYHVENKIKSHIF